jgi:phosphatidylinositol alpha-1,6-mannosyltransferase
LDQGGIASVNRSIIRALQTMPVNGMEIETRSLLHHGGAAQLDAGYVPRPDLFRAESCHSSRNRFLARYAWRCFRWRPHLVIVGHIHLAVAPYLFRGLVAPPYVVICHGVEFDESLSRLRQAAFRGACLRLGGSHFTANRLQELFPDRVVERCPLGVDEIALPAVGDNLSAIPDAFGVPRELGSDFVLIVARLASRERYKGHDQLIAIMPSILKQVPTAQLVVAGGGDDLERLKEVARVRGMGRAILFPGFVSPSRLATLYSRCRLFAMPSRGEGFGLVYAEAMLFAKPCIASRVDGGSEVVVDGQTGFLVDPSNLDELRDAIVRLLTERGLAERLGRAGRERLEANYCFSHYRSRFQSLLASILPELSERNSETSSGKVLVPAGE